MLKNKKRMTETEALKEIEKICEHNEKLKENDNKVEEFENLEVAVNLKIRELMSIHFALEFFIPEMSKQLPNIKKMLGTHGYNHTKNEIDSLKKIKDKIDSIIQTSEDSIYGSK